MSYPSDVFFQRRRAAGGAFFRAFHSAAPALAAVVLFCTFSMAAASVFAEEEGTIAKEAGCLTPAYENPSRRYVAWPLIFIDETADWRQFSFIPFYVQRETVDASEERTQLLWPIYMRRRSDDDVTIRVVPFYTYRKSVFAYADGEQYDLNYMLFPFIFGSDSTEEGRAFALFPIAGRLNSFMGRDQIRFLLFPLYMDYQKGEMQQRNYLWPILSFSEGGGYNGFRLWPLYGHMEREGKYQNKFALWPIYSRQEFDLDKEQSGERLMVFPFYAREESRAKSYRSVLWPFFSREQNYLGGFERRSMPWPFVVMARGDFHQTQLWPLYGYKSTEGRESKFLLWPFWRTSHNVEADSSSMSDVYLAPIIHFRTKKTAEGDVTEHKERVWPLWRFQKYEDGSERFRMLSLLWFDDERGFEREYSPLWTIYERKEDPDGDNHINALFGLVRHKRCGPRAEMRIPLLFSRISDSEKDFKESKILGGLITSTKDAKGRRIRLLRFRKD